ncbi:helix-turn-helix transcriptional regulator [Cohnella massiliensis]|mgnify:CR=1 FL=1|uniref:helix-turn-helix transcriptional regulator n=1 Tax=Cohnella massiliensis TaxID=1816691 RepID=UPI0009B9F95E|nr:helix-turn-helix domain-containing protein [Cohnella massiliensis]
MQNKLAALRRFFGKTQSDMATLIGVDVRTYKNKELGITQFKASEMFAIAKEFKKPIEEIFLPENFEKHEVS